MHARGIQQLSIIRCVPWSVLLSPWTKHWWARTRSRRAFIPVCVCRKQTTALDFARWVQLPPGHTDNRPDNLKICTTKTLQVLLWEWLVIMNIQQLRWNCVYVPWFVPLHWTKQPGNYMRFEVFTVVLVLLRAWTCAPMFQRHTLLLSSM
jgi:hypothetical protein